MNQNLIKYILLSPAKINLFLKIINKRDDGYHNLISGVQKISLFDILKIKVIKDGRKNIDINFSNNSIDIFNNTIYSAILLFKEKYNFDESLKIFVKKYIPPEAGLGGGSSNAATVIHFLNYLHNYPLNINELFQIGKKIGADVPLFISKFNTILMKGIGEQIEKFDFNIANHLILIIKPPFSISTKWAYKNLNLELTNKFKSINRAPSQISEFFNDLENVVLLKYPEIKNIKNILFRFGAEFSLMSGSGSAVFGLFKDRLQALNVVNYLKKDFKNYRTYLVKALI